MIKVACLEVVRWLSRLCMGHHVQGMLKGIFWVLNFRFRDFVGYIARSSMKKVLEYSAWHGDFKTIKRQSPLELSTRFRTRENFRLIFLSSIRTIHPNDELAVRMRKLFILLPFPAFHCWTTVSGYM